MRFMTRRLAPVLLFLLYPTIALADPEPALLGDVARPATRIDLRVPVAGELAPTTAREWLYALAPSFHSTLTRRRRRQPTVEAAATVTASVVPAAATARAPSIA